ncbi:hypothetical protein [Novosphingobium sp. 9U]|uniref:hypothetical protein n=1 Tax=Novosphingobium sp. 9U TaxID=2653158 RepID=UPI0012F0FCCF|nr:hypothetical protein [Novosphingobium sp. 9U]VWX51110.1 conserved membrane hypothetical protein [Novosphingobium sp. 9U]
MAPDANGNSTRFTALLSGVLQQVSAIALVGTAFFYYAGYTYLDTRYRAFGLNFGAASASTGEIIGWGYLATLFAAWQAIAKWIGYLVAEIILLVVLFGLIVVVVRRNALWREWLRSKLEQHQRTVDAVSSRILFICLCLIVLISSAPAGYVSAKYDITGIKKGVQKGCCYTYEDGTVKATGVLLGMDKDHLYVVTNRGLVTLTTAHLKLAPALASSAKRRSPLQPAASAGKQL